MIGFWRCASHIFFVQRLFCKGKLAVFAPTLFATRNSSLVTEVVPKSWTVTRSSDLLIFITKQIELVEPKALLPELRSRWHLRR